ncbi:MAG: SBBP repeat-containing protein [Bacteroidia bacterium]
MVNQIKFYFLITLTVLFHVSKASTIDKPFFSQFGFIENKGQIIDQSGHLNRTVLYLYNGNGLHVQLKQTGFSYEVWKTTFNGQLSAVSSNPPGSHKEGMINYNQQSTTDSTFIHRIDISFVNANQSVKIISSDATPDYINYYTTGTYEEGSTNIHHYKKVLYQNIYNNIDVEFVLNNINQNNEFKYNFIIHPGGKASDIKMKFDGANSTSLSDNEHIIIETAYGNIDESIPLSYQLDDNYNQQNIASSFNIQNPSFNIFGVSIGNYDVTKTLIIDPVPWATYYGGGYLDYSRGITTDTGRYVIITGKTSSTTGIATSGAYQSTLGGGGNEDAFIAKFDSNGSRIWATYYGGVMTERGNSITCDKSGNVFITGQTTSTSQMATSGTYQTVYGGGSNFGDAFIAKFSSSGSRIWATYFGGNGDDAGFGIAVDTSGNIFITGSTTSSSAIATNGAYQTTYSGGANGGDAFIAKFNSQGSILWSTYYGGTGNESGNGIIANKNGTVYITGSTTSFSLGSGAFILKFSSGGLKIWGTACGAGSGNGITTDPNGNIIITGNTISSTNFASNGAYQTAYGGGICDAFIAKFDSSGTPVWSTYYGGSDEDYGYAIATDTGGNVCITGTTASKSAIASNGAYQIIPSYIYVAKFNSTGNRLWATYLGIGGYADDEGGRGITTDISGNIFLTGATTASSGIATGGAFKFTGGGGVYPTTFIAAFMSNGVLLPPLQNNTISPNQIICTGSIPAALYGSLPTGGSGIFSYKWQKSTTSASTGFVNAGGYDSSRYYAPAVLTNTTWYRRISSSASFYDTSSAISITVNQKPNVGFTINTSLQCLSGNSFFFDDTTGGSVSRLWNLGDLTTNINDTFSKTYVNPGTYNVKLKVTNSFNCSDSITKAITVKPNPAKPIITPLSKSQLQSSVANSYQWYMNNNPVTGATLQTLLLTQNGTYNVKIDSTNGCSNISDPFSAIAVDLYEIYNLEEIKIYPNPFSNDLSVMINLHENTNRVNFELTDIQGRILFSKDELNKPGGNPINLKFGDLLENGFYFLRIRVATKVEVIKLLKQN